jgi:7-keto-8-aminopelargonate synthetase-like enzyme
VAGSRDLIDFLSQRARTFLFDTALPAPAAAAALEAVRIMAAEPERVATLRHNASRLHSGLLASGYRVVRADSAILPVEFDDPQAARGVCEQLLELEIVAIPVGPPHVRAGTSRIRVQASAAHTDTDVDRILTAFAAAAPNQPA